MYLIRTQPSGERSVAVVRRLPIGYATKWRKRGSYYEGDGVIKSKLQVSCPDHACDGFGKARPWSDLTFKRTKAAGSEVIRRMREEDDDALDHINADIASAKRWLQDLQRAKDLAIRDSWTRGETIALAELTAAAAEREADHKARFG